MRDGGSFQRTSKVTRFQPSYLPAVLSCEKHSLLEGPARNCRHPRLLGRATKGRLCAGGLRPYPLFSTRKLIVWGSRWCLARGGVWLEVVFVAPPRVIFLAVSRHLETKRLQVAPPRGKRHLAAAIGHEIAAPGSVSSGRLTCGERRLSAAVTSCGESWKRRHRGRRCRRWRQSRCWQEARRRSSAWPPSWCPSSPPSSLPSSARCRCC